MSVPTWSVYRAGQHSRRFWVLHYVNGDEFFGRFDGRWTRTGSLGSAALFLSEGEAQNALQALLAEADEQVTTNKERARQFWFDVRGGLVEVAEVEQITRVVAAVDPLEGGFER